MQAFMQKHPWIFAIFVLPAIAWAIVKIVEVLKGNQAP
jgi:hypothetical protein